MACTSQSIVAVAKTSQPKKARKVSSYKENPNYFGFLPLLKTIQRFIRSIKNFSNLFVNKDNKEIEMEIGYPTDVKHVTHVGLNGSSFSNIDGWENTEAPELISLPSISLKQFELAMAAQLNPSNPS